MTNVLLITVDDMNYDSLGCTGCPVDNISPNIDKLASEGAIFNNSFVAIAVCQPSRSVLMTGRYPHRNGARGFEDIDAATTTLSEQLKKNGYYNGIIGKEDHLAPKEKFFWDEYIATYNDENNWGRDPENYYKHTKSFLDNAKKEGKPFFLMANSHDPHRPYANSEDELDFFNRHVSYNRLYTPEEVVVGKHLPDIKDVRLEMAQYFTSVHRADESVGRIIDALKESGEYDNTIILFLTDNGQAVPFCKTNCYLNSTKSPYIMRYPKLIKPGTVVDALVNSIDYTPTILEMLGIKPIIETDGKSFLHCLVDKDEQYDDIFTLFFKTAANKQTGRARQYPMRSVQTKDYTYIFNSWSDNNVTFMNESTSGLTFKAMVKESETNPEVKARVDMFLYRVKEELYDNKADKSALVNLIDSKEHQQTLSHLRERMYDYMLQTGDSLINEFVEVTGVNPKK